MNTFQHLTRAVRAIKKPGEHTARWTMMLLGAFFIILEIDIIWDGAIYKMWRSVWENLIITHPSIPYWLGVVSCWLVLRRKKQLEERIRRDPDKTPTKGNKSVDLSVESLAAMGEKMEEKK